MEDKTFARTLEDLNQQALMDIIDDVLRCWRTIQQGTPVHIATSTIANDYKRKLISQVLLYMLLQSLLFDARQRQMIDRKRYEELRSYIDALSNLMKQQPFTALLFPFG